MDMRYPPYTVRSFRFPLILRKHLFAKHSVGEDFQESEPCDHDEDPLSASRGEQTNQMDGMVCHGIHDCPSCCEQAACS